MGKNRNYDIPLFRLEYSDQFIDEFCQEARKVLERGFLSEGPLSRQWEKDFAVFQKVPAALSVTSCTTGLEAILKKYHISLNRIFSANYVQQFFSPDDYNIFSISKKIIDGLNPNEVILLEKTDKNKGFFERFFNFFS